MKGVDVQPSMVSLVMPIAEDVAVLLHYSRQLYDELQSLYCDEVPRRKKFIESENTSAEPPGQ